MRDKPSIISSQRGFTLIELMMAVVIAAILTAIALPSYQDYVIRGKIPDALSLLASKRIQLEQFYQDRGTYTAAPACETDSSSSQFFTVSCSTQDDQTYTLRAVGRDTMSGFTYTIDQNNTKTTENTPSDWTLPNPNTCWVTQKGGNC